jgi:uncharacterized membrane protein
MSMLVVFVVGMFFLGMFVLGILLAYSLPYPSVDFATLSPILTFLGSLCLVSGVGVDCLATPLQEEVYCRGDG